MALRQSFFTWSAEWETKISVAPWSIISCILRSHFCWNMKSPTERISSTIRISGTTTVAMEKPSRATIPEEKFFTGTSTNSHSSAKSKISWNLASINAVL